MRHSQKAALARVWWINLATCCVHFSAVLMTIILWTDWTVPVTTSFISWEMKNQTNDMGCRDGNCFVKSAFATWDGVPDISLLGLVISFHALSFLWQFCVIFDGPVADFYHADIARGRNTMRWCEYALSAPLMICVISAVLGQVDVVVYASRNVHGDADGARVPTGGAHARYDRAARHGMDSFLVHVVTVDILFRCIASKESRFATGQHSAHNMAYVRAHDHSLRLFWDCSDGPRRTTEAKHGESVQGSRSRKK